MKDDGPARVLNLRNFRHERAPGGFALPEDVVRIDRGSPWGNPFRIGDMDPQGRTMVREQVLVLYRRYLNARLEKEPDYLTPLRSMRLACWCSPKPCHGDIILEHL